MIRIKCPYCTRRPEATSLSWHLSRDHGMYGTKSPAGGWTQRAADQLGERKAATR